MFLVLLIAFVWCFFSILVAYWIPISVVYDLCQKTCYTIAEGHMCVGKLPVSGDFSCGGVCSFWCSAHSVIVLSRIPLPAALESVFDSPEGSRRDDSRRDQRTKGSHTPSSETQNQQEAKGRKGQHVRLKSLCLFAKGRKGTLFLTKHELFFRNHR